MSREDAPCRLYVFLARDKPIGVVLRRGPSAWTRLSLWHTDRDEFIHGQWFGGRIYERRSDISPDGSLFLYFARKSSRLPHQDSWLAISRPPWFTALSLWFVGGTYFTGAFFKDAQIVWLGGITDDPDQGSLPTWLGRSNEVSLRDRSSNWTESTVYFNRLLRDGWVRTTSDQSVSSWEHSDDTSRRTLIMTEESESSFTVFGGPHVVHYAVIDRAADDLYDLGRLTWADWDHRGRLIIARDGRLWHWTSPEDVREIADFRTQVPDAQPSPPEARIWPGSPHDKSST